MAASTSLSSNLLITPFTNHTRRRDRLVASCYWFFVRSSLSQDDIKKPVTEKAVSSVRSGMVLSLGTGSTVDFVVAWLGFLLRSGELTDIVGIPTSKRSEEQAWGLGIPLSVLDEHLSVNHVIDGVDEVNPELNLIKGRWGALLKEKMVEAASKNFVVIVDESKLVDGLGDSGLAMPVEVMQFQVWFGKVEGVGVID